MISKTLVRRLVVLVGLSVLLFGLYLFIINFLKATLVINTERSASVSIYKLDKKKTRVWSDANKATHSVRLAPGSYSIQVTKDYSSTKQLVKLGFRQKKSTDIKLVGPLASIQVFENGSDALSERSSRLIQIDDQTGNILSAGRDVAFNLGNKKLASFAYSEKTGSILGLMRNGQLVYSNPDGALTIVDANSTATMVSYDRALDQFCALIDKRIVLINTAGAIINAVPLNGAATTVSCSNGAVAYADLSPIFDDKVKAKLRQSTIYFHKGGVEKSFKQDEVSAISLNETGSLIYFVGSGKLSAVEVSTGNATELLNVSSNNRNSIVVRGSSLVVFDSAEAWRVEEKTQTATRLLSSKNFTGLTGVYITADGDISYSISAGFNQGTFITTSNQALAVDFQNLSLLFPYTSPDFAISTNFDGQKVILEVTILAPIPSSGDTRAYSQARVEAENYISNLGLDMTKIEIRYR